MPAVPRPCLGCGTPTRHGSRCPTCTETLRGSFTERRGIGGWSWAKLRAHVRQRDGGCRRCGATTRLEVHHVIPLSRGGTNDPDNLVTLCRTCHRASHGS